MTEEKETNSEDSDDSIDGDYDLIEGNPSGFLIKQAQNGNIDYAYALLERFWKQVKQNTSVDPEILQYFSNIFRQITDKQIEPTQLAHKLGLVKPAHRPELDNTIRDMLIAALVKSFLEKKLASSVNNACEKAAECIPLSTITINRAYKKFVNVDDDLPEDLSSDHEALLEYFITNYHT